MCNCKRESNWKFCPLCGASLEEDVDSFRTRLLNNHNQFKDLQVDIREQEYHWFIAEKGEIISPYSALSSDIMSRFLSGNCFKSREATKEALDRGFIYGI